MDCGRKYSEGNLLERLAEIAQQAGIRTLHAEVLVQNSGMLKIFHRSGLHTETSTEAGVVRVDMTLPEKAPAATPRAEATAPGAAWS